MHRLRTLSLGCLACAVFLVSGVCGQQAQLVANGKAATALVDLTEHDSSATAFCVRSDGVFVTNYHVVEDLSDDATFELVLGSGTDQEKIVTVYVVAIDEENDLAILKTKKKGRFKAMKVGDDSKLFETADLFVFGFPFGKGLSVKPDAYPAMSVNRGAVTAIRKEDGNVKLIQFDADVNPGNSGGPVCNAAGEVVGVVSFGLESTELNFAIPSRKVLALLRRPIVTRKLPVITGGNMGRRVPISVVVKEFVEPIPDATVRLEVSVDGADPRKIGLTRDKDTYSGTFIPNSKAGNGGVSLDVQKGLETKSIKVADITIAIGEDLVYLSDVVSIKALADSTVSVSLVTGKRLKGAMGKGAMVMDVTGERHSLTDATEVLVHSLRPAPRVTYTLVVKSGDLELTREDIRASGVSGNGFASEKPAAKPYSGGLKKINLPTEIANVTLAAGGRMLLIELPGAEKLAVFDANKGAIVATIPLPWNALVVGSLEFVHIIDQSRNVIERWSLTSFQKERSAGIPFAHKVVAAAAGHASRTAILVRFGRGPRVRNSYGMIDQLSMEALDLKITNMGRMSSNQPMCMSSDAFGRLFLVTSNRGGAAEYVWPTGTTIATGRASVDGYGLPTADGTLIATATGMSRSILVAAGIAVSARGACIPSTHPRLYISLPESRAAMRGTDPGPAKLRSVVPSSDVLPLPALELGVITDTVPLMTLGKRVYYFAGARLLLSIPFKTDRELVLQPFDVTRELGNAQQDAFFLLSTAASEFRAGKTWTYNCRVLSTRGAVRFRLSEGPKGMSVSADGVVKWKVPSKFAEPKVLVRISIMDPSGETIRDAFVLQQPTR